MDFVENIRVGEEGAETGIGAEIERAAAVLGSREVCWIGFAEDTPAESDEPGMLLLFQWMYLHGWVGTGVRRLRLDLRNENLKRIDRQILWWFGRLEAFGAGEQDLEIMTFDASGAREIQVQFFL